MISCSLTSDETKIEETERKKKKGKREDQAITSRWATALHHVHGFNIRTNNLSSSQNFQFCVRASERRKYLFIFST